MCRVWETRRCICVACGRRGLDVPRVGDVDLSVPRVGDADL